MSVAPTGDECLQIKDDLNKHPVGATSGFGELQDLCASGLASLTANYFVEKLLVSCVV